uniref:Uncharacterized protein n=1 Tax=Rhizophora mucronata TaxID=61149 RepID=A0A2P2J2I2_RHIMU
MNLKKKKKTSNNSNLRSGISILDAFQLHLHLVKFIQNDEVENSISWS